MLSIGQIAQGTGVSRRMLRHWETLGLIEPARVDESTGYRRYAQSQIGRVRAVTSLRALGFGLEAIVELLDAGLTETRLVALLQARERELAEQVDEASARLAEVRSRLASVEKGNRTVMDTLRLAPLPALRLSAVRTTVLDETEIPRAAGEAVARLREHLRSQGVEDAALVLTFDGTADDVIVVTAGVETDAQGRELDVVEVPAVPEGVSVTFDQAPALLSDAWAAVDAELADRRLRTTGVHRQLVASGGALTLQAEVRALAAEAGPGGS
ncbi:MerR family transcriptional regulator [Cellulomonas xiejunii]|uniref:MerR family transcriptional regulator n=1 Tax=Cellulomonas xiejunii TaxID=2968083 RepID=A0ABY5KP18_9CELL|nr:MerR family transcriptional regulator [Cellulomonas xiejunii]MCC2322188.1 MerR family transcriptional regulator [Cellulomonas xiejunii]UUI72242.1 MerR family transcriptional regulator [Cellulomonas xiejunii]